MTSWISTPVIPPGVPVARSTRVSAISLAAAAGVPGGAEGVGVPGSGRCRRPTPAVIGSRAVRWHMVSGAGRRLTYRSVAACAARSVTVRGSSRYAAARAVATSRRSPGPGEGPGVGGEVRVDGGPVRGGQAGGFAHQQGGAPFVELPGLERGEGVRHLGHEGFGQAEEPAALGGGFVPGQGDLRADPGPELLRGDPGGGLGAALEQVEGHGEPGLLGGRGALLVLEFPDPVDDPRHCPWPVGGRPAVRRRQ